MKWNLRVTVALIVYPDSLGTKRQNKKGVREMGAALKEVPVNRKPSYRRRVERILKNYPIIKAAVELQQQEEAAGYGDFPACIASYEERVSAGYSEYNSSTERYGIWRATKYLELQRIEMALMVLDFDERFLIEERYFDRSGPSDSVVYDRLGWSKRHYYRVKARAIKKLAVVLGLF